MSEEKPDSNLGGIIGVVLLTGVMGMLLLAVLGNKTTTGEVKNALQEFGISIPTKTVQVVDSTSQSNLAYSTKTALHNALVDSGKASDYMKSALPEDQSGLKGILATPANAAPVKAGSRAV